MKRNTILIFLVAGVGFSGANVFAQTGPVFLRLKGVGIGDVPTPGAVATDVQVVGNYAYLTWLNNTDSNHWGGMEIYTVTNPSAPARVGGYETRRHVNSLHVVGDYAYLALGTLQTGTNDPGSIEIVDVRDPARPTGVGGVGGFGRGLSVRVSNNYAYLAESIHWTGSNLIGRLEIFDVSNRNDPALLASFDTAGSATSVDISGNYLYFADGVTDVQVLDVSDPYNPQRVGVYSSAPAHITCGFELGGPGNYVQLLENVAYSAGDNGVNVLDVSDPTHPSQIGNFCWSMYTFQRSGRYAYATTFSSYANTFFLQILDANNPASLMTVGFKENWEPSRLHAVDPHVYTARFPLQVYEITDRPSILSFSITYQGLVLTCDHAPGFVLQRTASLNDSQWMSIPGTEGQSRVVLPMDDGQGFFRLARFY
jgi:hypothetical protein